MSTDSFVNPARTRRRKRMDRLFLVLCYGAALSAIVILIALLAKLVIDGVGRLDRDFLTRMASFMPDRAGIKGALIGSTYIMILTALITVPLGVGAAVYLEEFNTKRNRLVDLIQLNISNLSGVPSIVYGMLGLAVFIPFFIGIFGDPQSGRGIITGAMTMSLLILPMVILVSQEALKAVPSSFREGSLAVGATRWQTIRRMVLPNALPGILTGIILALSRAIGETAPLIVVGAVGFVTSLPRDLTDGYMVLPLQIFEWASRPESEFHELAASAIIVLMVVLLLLNSIAIVIRSRAQKRL